jgi:hypothetical protein
MTRCTVRAKLTVVSVIVLMAGIAICGRAFENIILMTRLASFFSMLTFEFEGSKVMIKFCWPPCFCGMAILTNQTESTLMRFILLMTGITVARKSLKSRNAACIEVALRADQACMFASQLKSES